ncbi:probable methyltransferase-like protein 25 isoform X2 [Apostichopus japonicus]|uniref:probable methyltransferase-like protein 25 isoform X2 n=1 Tax=Stichopus japonicus TaxID=307972 RepID=UPI003AB3B3C1
MAVSKACTGLRKVHGLLNDLLDVFNVYKDVLRSNTVDFYTINRIDLLRNANPRLLDEMSKLSGDGLVRLACGEFDLTEERKNDNLCDRNSEETFPEVCKLSQQSQIRCERLEHECHCYYPSAGSFTKSLALEKDASILVKPKEFMNLKKSHEVAEMSHLCSSLIRQQQIEKVIDIGSGKGYLSQYLTLQFGVRVIGIDSSDTNTHGAKERGRKLLKHWKTFMRRSAEQQNKLYPKEVVDPMGQSSVEETNDNSEAIEPEMGDGCTTNEPDESRSLDSTSESAEAMRNVPRLSSLAKVTMTGNQEKPDVNNLPQRNKYSDIESHRSQFEPVTAFVSSATDLASLTASLDVDEGRAFETDPFLLVGLHTCGDLGATLTQLFVDCPSAVAMCLVPCCYHFVTEEFEPKESRFWKAPSELNQWGFPMSQYLRGKEVNIGRDARMLACMAQERMAVDGKIPIRALFFRAVLQVLLRDHYRIPSRKEAVGKLASKCKDFVEYARRAMTKLGFEHEKMTDEEIDQYYQTYLEKMNSLEVFTAARLAFSRMVESLLLLDKLCFLLEQPDVESASIVRLFDPVQSPRCYAVVATKKTAKT